MKSVTHS